MVDFLESMRQKAQANPKRIVFPESKEERIIRAIQTIREQKIAVPILVGNAGNTEQLIRTTGYSLDGINIIDPLTSPRFEAYAQAFYELRKGKGMTLDKARETIKEPIYFATMMLYMGDADGLVSGSNYTTAQTVLPALQIIKTKERFRKVSGLFIMINHVRMMLFADCSITIEPDAKDLADIALDSAITARKFGMEPRVAMLSFSTHGSASHPLVDKMREATELLRSKDPTLLADGEIQVDAAIIPEVAQIKCPDSPIKGDANILIFPDVNCGNIAYKLVERLGKYKAVGPILQGLKKPVNDLSRGCSVQDIVDVTTITVVQAQEL